MFRDTENDRMTDKNYLFRETEDDRMTDKMYLFRETEDDRMTDLQKELGFVEPTFPRSMVGKGP